MATVLVNLGEAWMCASLAGSADSDGRWVGWGTGAGTAAKADAALFTEASEARVAGIISLVGTSSAMSHQVVSTLTADGAKTITNAGTFTQSSGATLLVHADFAGVTLAANDAIQFTFQINPS